MENDGFAHTLRHSHVVYMLEEGAVRSRMYMDDPDCRGQALQEQLEKASQVEEDFIEERAVPVRRDEVEDVIVPGMAPYD